MIKNLILVLALFSGFITYSQESNPFYVGHSLVNFDMPAMVQGLAEDANKTTHYDAHIGIGAPLIYNYDENNEHGAPQGTSYRDAFPAGNHNTLIITEAIPLQNHLSYSDTYLYANNFYNYAKANNNSNPIKFYIYETWHCTNSGIPAGEPNAPYGCEWDDSANSTTLWHPRLIADFPLWSGIVTDVRNENPTDTEIWMVPAGQAFYNLTTEINAGNVPGITDFTDLFSDDIHLTNAGNYFIACVMYATVYGESPEGLTQNINNQWGSPFTDMPTTAQALVMQEVAWETVTSLTQWTGVSITVPLEWTQNTKAEVLNSNVKISFAAAHQINNSHFEIEHSRDGRTFDIIGKIQGEKALKTESYYEFMHRNPPSGTNFYRVKQVDDDGKYLYGNVASVNFNSRKTEVYPNPVIGTLKVNSSSADIMVLYNHLGQVLLKKSIIKGLNEIDISDFKVGIYVVKFGSGMVERILKE